jgi:hypothetical protein
MGLGDLIFPHGKTYKFQPKKTKENKKGFL